MAEAVYEAVEHTNANQSRLPMPAPAAAEATVAPLMHEPTLQASRGDAPGAEARHAAILGDPRLQQAGPAQRMRLVQQLQRSSGNSYVERVMDQIQRRAAPITSTAAATPAPTLAEQASALQSATLFAQAATQAETRGAEQAGLTKLAQTAVQADQQRAAATLASAHADRGMAKVRADQPAAHQPIAVAGAHPQPRPAHGPTGAPVGAGKGRAPTSPHADPAFQAVVGKVKGVASQQQAHPPAPTKASAAQAAAESPASELSGKAADKQVGKLQQTETPPFDAAGFKAKLMERIASLAPKNLEEADNFKQSDKLGGVKQEMQGNVTAEQAQSKGPLAEQAATAPDPSSVTPKPVTPLAPNVPGAPPADVGAAGAAPKAKPAGAVEAPLQANSAKPDQQMAAAHVTEQQLQTSNEPTFQAALGAKHQAQAQAQTGARSYRKDEQGQLGQAQTAAIGTAQTQTHAMHTGRAAAFQQVGGQQTQTKGKDEQARAKVGADIQTIYNEVKGNVESKLNGLDTSVTKAFDDGANAAQQTFEDFIDAKMNAYKAERYGGPLGWTLWIRDLFAGLPEEVNVFYSQGRDVFVHQMDIVINQVVTIIGTAITAARAEIERGKARINEYVAGLPTNLRQVGQDAATQIQGQFDELSTTIDSKQDALIDSLAQKYQEKLQAIDARIGELKEANKGFVQKAMDFIGGVIKTILELGRMLLQVLARVAEAVGKILSNPIGFLNNLIGGVAQGFKNFVANIANHLKAGLMEWLFGELAAAGIAIPQSFDLKSILLLAMELLGMTWQFIRRQAVKRLGEKVVATLEGAFSIFKLIKEQGIGALWESIKEQVGDLQESIMGGIKDMVIVQVIQAGVQWLLGILGGPVGAFIKAAKAIFDIVMWFVNNGSRVLTLLNAIIDSIGAIARGTLDQAAALIEKTLAQSISIVISFLASLLGLGSLAGKIRGVIQKAKQPVEKAVNWVLDKAVAFAKLLGGKVKGAFGGKNETEADKQKRLRTGVMAGVTAVERLKGRDVTAALIRPVLGGLKSRYRLGVLEPVEQDGYWAVHGEVNRMTVRTNQSAAKGHKPKEGSQVRYPATGPQEGDLYTVDKVDNDGRLTLKGNNNMTLNLDWKKAEIWLVYKDDPKDKDLRMARTDWNGMDKETKQQRYKQAKAEALTKIKKSVKSSMINTTNSEALERNLRFEMFNKGRRGEWICKWEEGKVVDNTKEDTRTWQFTIDMDEPEETSSQEPHVGWEVQLLSPGKNKLKFPKQQGHIWLNAVPEARGKMEKK